jgi:hypothetical protein
MSVLKRCALALQFGSVVCLLFFAKPLEAATLTVGWDPSSAPGVAGYLVSYGQQPGVYTSVVDAGNQTAESIPGLADGTTYYFAVRAYDAAGLKSGYSTEIGGTTPEAVSVPQPPDMPGIVSPPSSATAVAGKTPLMWSPSANASRYDVAFGTANPPQVVSAGQAGTAYQPPLPLMANTTYFWQVIASNAAGSTASPVWTFRTAPASSASATSPDGTIVSSGGQIVDAAGAIWTIGLNQQILRNGTHAANGLGTKILWTLNTIYVLGTDNNWWKWNGSGWTNAGPTQPGTAVVVRASADGATVPPAASIVDAQGASWTIGSGGRILRNSTQAGNGVGSAILWWSSNIYALGTDANWWRWHGDVNRWTNVGRTKPNASAIVPAAVFVGTDVSTQGSWKGLYGGDGYAIAGDATSLPSYATVAQTGQLTWVWAASTSDARGLEKSAGTDRVASAWYGGSFSMDVDFTDGLAHDMAIYVADYDAKNRAQTVKLVDPSTGAILDSRAMTAFTGGQYWVWNVRGRVTVVVTATSSSAVVSGIFFDSIGGTQNHPPVVAMTSPAANAAFTAPATVVLGAAATDADGTVEKVAFYTGSTLIGTVTTAPFVLTCSNVAAGTYTVVAVATDNFGATTTSAPVQVTVNGAKTTTTAAFLGTDTRTQGTWKGVYGSGGYALANDAMSLPSYAAVSAQELLSWTFTTSTTAVSALQKATQTGRMAAVWYGSTMTIDLNLLDGAKHQVSIYLLDWDSGKRQETIQVVDAVTKAVLDSRSVSQFQNGQYWGWTISGHVLIQVINGAGSPNAVFSGVFFDK